MKLQSKSKKGFTLIELLIVIAILALLLMAALFGVSRQRSKAEDAKAKADLDRLKISFEDYYNDHNCYPPAEWFDGPEDCNSISLRPYQAEIKCDSRTGKPYLYEPDSTGCKSFKLFSNLINESGLYCDSLGVRHSYGVTSTNISIENSCLTASPGASATPTPAPVLQYYCQAVANCASFNSVNWDCTPSFADSGCSGSNNCQFTGSCTHR